MQRWRERDARMVVMDEKPIKKRSRWPAIVMALVLLLPPAYVLSTAPMWAVAIKHQNGEAFFSFYQPLLWLSHHSRPFAHAMEWYCGLWPKQAYSIGWA